MVTPMSGFTEAHEVCLRARRAAVSFANTETLARELVDLRNHNAW
jgi:hypothetical protein